ncbi:MAG: glycosyltransferase [Chitinivibrionales bacterium]|nr:glycosyltransferase [Chitinivibrionales bacterium]
MGNDKALVTAVITTHNRSNILRKAIESALNQTYKPIEIFVVDDCSRDDTKNVVAAYSAINYIRNTKNLGGARSRMKAARLAKGKYIAFLDDDDQWRPEKIERQVNVAEASDENLAVVTCSAEVHMEQYSFLLRPKMRGRIRSQVLTKDFNTVPSCHLFIKSIFDEIDGYDFDLPAHNEHDIWMKMAEADYYTERIIEPLVDIFETGHPKMMSNYHKRKESFGLFTEKWYAKVLNWHGNWHGKKLFNQYLCRIYASSAALSSYNGNPVAALGFMLLAFKYILPCSLNGRVSLKLFEAVVWLIVPQSNKHQLKFRVQRLSGTVDK